ncbi:hypothetical protein [Pseudalkalibacillus hwajinpoensis]|uniref:Uncharacterized protein n=1 Tax=Guptibacillus hwajinpoensis TaxID=208199 RepID=A0A4U1MJF0_9BACL|nr:hypothetical protein [Pseudalkalibacillus hwajinpoensis]TKD70851.1 hypothetical protein FBF83_09570 [Pseudalkalibacillus hwajinpoensis]
MKKKLTAFLLAGTLVTGITSAPASAANPDKISGGGGYSIGCAIWNYFSDNDICVKDPYFGQ